MVIAYRVEANVPSCTELQQMQHRAVALIQIGGQTS